MAMARALRRCGASAPRDSHDFPEHRNPMVKPEWGAKRTCPKCGTRFYDLNKEDPVVCINCGNQWIPEPVLKSKQPLPFDAPKKDSDKIDPDLFLSPVAHFRNSLPELLSAIFRTWFSRGFDTLR